MSKERGIFLVEFNGGGKVVCGNNYKPWWDHARELVYRSQGDREKIREHGWRYEYVAEAVKSVSYSNQPFYDDGGLKWCDYDSYQEIIDEVCKRDKLAPVKLEDIQFEEVPAHQATLTKKLKEY